MKKQVVLTALIVGLLALQGGAFAQSRVVDMDFRDADVLDVFRVLGEMGGLNVLADKSVTGNVTFFLKSMPVMDAIDLVARTSGYRYKVVGNTLVVASEERLAQEFTEEEVTIIQPQYLSPQTAKEIAAMALDAGKIIADERTGALILRGAEDQIVEVQALLKKFDVPLPLEFDFVDTPVQDMLLKLTKAGGYSAVIGPLVQGRLTMYLKDKAIPDAIDVVARTAGVEYYITKDGMMVFGMPQSGLTDEPFNTVRGSVEPVKSRVFEIRYLPLETAKKLIQSLFPGVQVEADSNTGVFVMRGTADELEQAREILKERDIPQIVVKGIVKRGEDRIAVLEINGNSQVVKEKDQIGEFTVETIGDKEIVISRGEYVNTFPVGGVR